MRVRHTAIGLNFIDTYRRSGLYPVDLPAGLGIEAAGVVEAVGPGVTGFTVGDRVAYATGAVGAYADRRNIAADVLLHVPDAVADEIAAAAVLKGMTAGFLAERCARMTAGQTALVHSAAGGVGSILVQWLKAIGVTVIAHAGSAEKAAKAKALGADHALDLPYEALAARVRDLTGGRGVDAVFDGVGKDSWAASLASTAKRGLIASYGNASGPVPPVPPLDLSRAGSLFLTRPTLFDYVGERQELVSLADRLFTLIANGAIRIEIGQAFPLSAAADAHRALEGRQTTGSTVLLP
ncbi:quinone oxidoreductase family protein [Sphingomonas sp. ID0503]|uniref:quinone oxidoreductase family protein n=1 Tax=Sphingomonas sp. ID0503 TaxID=3399691 RepID=UPI003AFB5AC6